MPAKPIICVGHAALDYVYRIAAFPPKPTKIRALEHIESGGGMAANASVAIARLGGTARLWSRTGDDETGARIRRGLERENVDISHVLARPGAKSATSAIIVDGNGERLVAGEDDRDMPMSADWLPVRDIASAGAVLSDLTWREGTCAAFREARAKRAPTLLDVDLGGGKLLGDVLDLTDYAILSAGAFEQFIEGADYEERLSWLVASGVRHAGVTRGAKGYLWKNRDGGRGYQAAFPVDAVDTTGAGDAFHGAFAWALARGSADAECARIASAAAALKCRRLGARAGLPTALELDAFLRERTGRGHV